MTALGRIVAIVKADFRIRFRRVSTLVVFLLLSFSAYLWVPDPSTGRAIFVANGKRALYTSGALGMATAIVGTLFVGLFGYYVVSNALRRDLQTRCGFVLSSTPMRSGEYLLGKFLGNVTFLTVFMAGFMVSAMAMLLIRGEASLEPWTFARQYLLLTPPSIIFVSAVAVTFESIPFLSGRFGDVVYFFLWVTTLGGTAVAVESGANAALYFDTGGFAYLFTELKRTLATSHFSIGATPYDPAKGIFVFDGLSFRAELILPRVVSALVPLPLLLVARLFFHRFDPARVKATHAARGRWLGRLGALVKPLTRPIGSLQRILVRGRPSLLRSAIVDSMLALMMYPALLLAIVGLAIAALTAPLAGILPIAIAFAAVAIADVPCREAQKGTFALVYSAPRIERWFVAWKLLATMLLASMFLLVPAVRLLSADRLALIRLIVGVAFIAAAAVLLGVVSANPKTFIVLFLTFWYVVINDKGEHASLDFAGFHGKATAAVTLGYLGIALASAAAAAAVHRWHRARA